MFIKTIFVKRYVFKIHFRSNGMPFCIFGYGFGWLLRTRISASPKRSSAVHSIGVNFRKAKKHPDVSAKDTGVKFPAASDSTLASESTPASDSTPASNSTPTSD